MKAVIITAAVLWIMGAGDSIAREPGAPRKNNPPAGALILSALIQLGLAGWAISTIL